MMIKKCLTLLILAYPVAALTFTITEQDNTFSGEKTFYSTSELAQAENSNFTGRLHIACNNKGEHWAYFVFSPVPVLKNPAKKTNYSIFSTNIKFGDNNAKKSYELKQDWGSRAFFFNVSNYDLYEKISSSNYTLIELESKDSVTALKFSMTDSRKSINSILVSCGLPQTKRKTQ